MDPDGHRLASTMARQGEGWAPVMRHVLRAHACDAVSGLRTCSHSGSISVFNFLHIHWPPAYLEVDNMELQHQSSLIKGHHA